MISMQIFSKEFEPVALAIIQFENRQSKNLFACSAYQQSNLS